MSGTCALVVPWHVSGFGYAKSLTIAYVVSPTCQLSTDSHLTRRPFMSPGALHIQTHNNNNNNNNKLESIDMHILKYNTQCSIKYVSILHRPEYRVYYDERYCSV